jgi:hypothetical protein
MLQHLCHRARDVILRKLTQLAAPLRLTIARLRGPARFGGGELSAVYAGNGTNLSFLRELFLSGGQLESLAEGVHPLSLSGAAEPAARDADLLLCELPRLWAPLLPSSATIRVPAWVRQEIDLPPTPGPQGWLLPRAVERETARRIRRHGYRVDFTSESEAKELFFRNFYRPYVQSRFGAGTFMDTEEVFMERARGQTLARLHGNGQWIAGLLIHRHGRSLRFGRFGAASDPPAPGASEVLDTLVVHRMHERGVRRIVMGDTRPCLADGVMRYKARFGARIRPTLFPQPILGIGISRWSAAAAACLDQQPLVRLHRGTPHAWRIRNDGRIALEPLSDGESANT